MTPLRTAADVRDYLLSNWRQVLPDLLVPQARIAPGQEDPNLVEVTLTGQGGPVTHLLLLPLGSGEPRLLRAMLPRLRELDRPAAVSAALLVPHMGAAGARLCRETGASYVDCCGNASLRFNQVLIQISGNRNRFAEPKRVSTVFSDKATIPLRILLQEPDSWLTTREIAERGDLSLGWVSQILQELDAAGHLQRRRGGGSRLVEPGRLLQEWLKEYSFEQNEVFPFQLRDAGTREVLERLRRLGAPWSGRYALTLETALAALSPPRQPSTLYLYVADLAEGAADALQTWPELLGLRAAGHGANCLLVKPTYRHAAFFDLQQREGLRLVSDLQLYLDLYHFPGAGPRRAQEAVALRLPFDLR